MQAIKTFPEQDRQALYCPRVAAVSRTQKNTVKKPCIKLSAAVHELSCACTEK